MCGFAGLISNQIDQNEFEKVLSKINYRGPDYSRTDKMNGWILGHNRLSILDLDARSHQPFYSEDKRYVLIFNGEIYNYKEIKEKLIKEGYKFRTESDTEVLLYSYDKWKDKCFIQFHGMFAFALIDNKDQKLILARDRFGEKPLFYTRDREEFSFASELKCLKSATKKNTFDLTAIIDYLHFGFVPAPKTIYQNIFKLKPGHFLEYSISERRIIKEKPFYTPSFDLSRPSASNSKQEEFNSIGLKVASQISLSDVPLGAFLSGGVDSSGAVYFLNQLNSQIHTFTAGFKSEAFDETRYAQKIVEHLHVKNTTRIIDFGDFVEHYDTMLNHYDEPHNDFSFIPTYIICKEAVKDYTVMISGDGADEIFCGYPRYHKLKMFSKIKGLPGVSKTISSFSRLLPEHSNLRRQLYFVDSSDTDFFFHTMSMNFMPEEISEIMGSDLKQASRNYSSRSIIENYLSEIPTDSHILQKQRYLDIKMTLADDMLVKTDRASMANSLEVRPFYLHPLISDFAFSLPIDELVTMKHDKIFLKKYFEGKLPHENLYRPKMGFTFPLRELIQGPLNGLFNECIKSLPEELITHGYLERILNLHGRGNRNYIAQLHSLMNLGLWIKKNM